MNFHVIVPCGEDSREGDLPGLFEFHRSCRLRCKIIQHAVNSRNLVCNSIGDVAHQLKRNILNGTGHDIHRIDCTDDAAPREPRP